MKFNYCFSLAMILIILFSLTTVMASDNITDEAPGLDDNDLTLAITSEDCADENLNRIDESQNILNAEGESADLDVRIDFENVYHGDDFNQPGYEVPWNVTAKVSDGIAHKTKVHITLSDNMKYVSQNKTLGTFNPETGIWDIGDLSSSDTALLIITTKLVSGERFILTANGTCDPQDVNLQNNYRRLPIRNGTKKIKSNTTETSDDKVGSNKGNHEGSISSTGFVKTEHESDEAKTDISNREKTNKKSESEKNSDSKRDASNQNNKQSPTNPYVKATSNIYKIAEESIKSIISPESDSDNIFAKHMAVIIPAYDYNRVPLIIFSLFLVILVGIVGYDKIKS